MRCSKGLLLRCGRADQVVCGRHVQRTAGLLILPITESAASQRAVSSEWVGGSQRVKPISVHGSMHRFEDTP